MKLQAKYYTRLSIVQMKMKDLEEIHKIGQVHIKNNVYALLQRTTENANLVVQEIADYNLLGMWNEQVF